ncbi:predicted protein [Phaeodactylum tricornutum CCAP 1055/1]|uniref:Uncharacterized protein n=1 Tax=Phaeodactylum tricornutum (strain CCAP 1055/1) TaxID=556484 RepID=B7FZP9_PHATC|nr:predicted protein [Phaeodactylum tricornutum CCAP 1055/1]EEC48176.1 predicted protein [Phaeodactylum tricornutum CCAP 1055/1]|eukprot:XP_002179985.1 predicted protein [Phaeodactylum tricornutum CCAP 1055/1]
MISSSVLIGIFFSLIGVYAEEISLEPRESFGKQKTRNAQVILANYSEAEMLGFKIQHQVHSQADLFVQQLVGKLLLVKNEMISLENRDLANLDIFTSYASVVADGTEKNAASSLFVSRQDPAITIALESEGNLREAVRLDPEIGKTISISRIDSRKADRFVTITAEDFDQDKLASFEVEDRLTQERNKQREVSPSLSAFGPSPGSKIIPRDSTESCCFAPLDSQELASMNISSETKRTENSVNDLSVNQSVENDNVVSAHATTREPKTEYKYETRESQTLEGQWNIIGKKGKSTISHDIGTKSSFIVKVIGACSEYGFDVIEVAVVVDSLLCAAVGGTEVAASTVAQSVIAGASQFYEVDGLCKKLRISYLEIHCNAGTDPIAPLLQRAGNSDICNTDANGLLQNFVRYTADQGIAADLNLLFHGKSFTGSPSIGCAFIGALCRIDGADSGVNEITFTSDPVSRAKLVAHECARLATCLEP